MRSVAELQPLFDEAIAGNRRALGRLLTVIERGGQAAAAVNDLAHAAGGNGHVIGITGAPGSGKSTVTGQMLRLLVAAGAKPAVLAVDPSSPLTGGAILGDRLRMDDGPDSFIRSMATRGQSGGLAVAVPAAVRLFDACGYNPIIIETVGVGQVEVDITGAADTCLVVVAPGWGDAVQANKAGLLEVADVFVVNKSDTPGAKDVRRDLEFMLDLGHVSGHEARRGSRPNIVNTDGISGDGIDEVLAEAATHLEQLATNGKLADRRRRRIGLEIRSHLQQQLEQTVDMLIEGTVGAAHIDQVANGSMRPSEAVQALHARLYDG